MNVGDKAKFINLMIERVQPWFKVEFLSVGGHMIQLRVGSVACAAMLSEGWRLRAESDAVLAESTFIERLNKVLSGMSRDDAGVLLFRQVLQSEPPAEPTKVYALKPGDRVRYAGGHGIFGNVHGICNPGAVHGGNLVDHNTNWYYVRWVDGTMDVYSEIELELVAG